MLARPLRLLVSWMPQPLSLTSTVRIPAVSVSTITSTRVAPACRAALDSASRSTASTCSESSPLARESSPLPSRRAGAKPSISAISSASATMSARSRGMLARLWDCSAKIVALMSLIVSSIASTALRTRSDTSRLLIMGIMPSSDMPVA
jgi:hypothetical protein